MVGPHGAIALSAILAGNNTIINVGLQGNLIFDEGAIAIASMLKDRNRTIQEVILDNNQISSIGQRALRNAVFDDSSFSAIQNSNHVLQSYFGPLGRVFGRPVMNDVLAACAANLRSKHPETAVTKKLDRVLKRKYCVRLHFQNFVGMDTNVMPMLIGWIATKCDCNMMYELKPILIHLLEGKS